MEILPIDQQKKAILYAPKELLWKILDEEKAWLKIFRVLPDEYFRQFLTKMRNNAVTDKEQLRTQAAMYIKNKVRYDHLQEAIAKVWNPTDLEDSTSWLKEQGFLDRPLTPLNLQASTVREIVAAAAATPKATRERLARSANNQRPRANHPPDGASPEATRAWNRVMRDPKRRSIILKPRSIQDQWSLAMKFWLSECATTGCQAYKSHSDGGSTSFHGTNSIQRSLRELASGLAYEGYSMSDPAARAYKQLWSLLKDDGYELGNWLPIKPKNRVK